MSRSEIVAQIGGLAGQNKMNLRRALPALVCLPLLAACGAAEPSGPSEEKLGEQ